MSVWVYTGEIGAKRLRERYFRAVLRQDISFFDRVGAGEVATRIQTDAREFSLTCYTSILCLICSSADLVQQGMSEKVAIIANMLGAFSTGFILAYARSWRLALALSSIFPFQISTALIMNQFVSKCTQVSLQHVANSGTVAEEVISTVRTAQAFGIQTTLADIFDTYIDQSKEIDAKAAIVQGGGLGIFFFIMYCAYALAFAFGTTLINEGHGE